MPRRFWPMLGSTLALILGAGHSTALAGLTGLDQASNSLSNSSNKTVTATCPAGKRVLGPLAVITGPGPLFTYNQAILDDFRPSADLTSVSVQALEDRTGTTDTWSLSAGAICGKPPPGLERVSATSALNSTNKSVTATCPGGKQVLGAGGDLNAGNGQVVLDDIRPNAALTSVTVQGVEDEVGQPGPWSVTAYAVCANTIAGLERISASSGFGGTDKFNALTCTDRRPTGVGAEINAGNGQAFFTWLQRVQLVGPDSYQAAVEDETGHPSVWSLTSYAICAPTLELGQNSSSPFDSTSPKTLSPTCLLSRHEAIGLGKIDVVYGTAGAEEVVTDRFLAGSATAHEDEGGFAGSWRLDGRSICTNPLAGEETVTSTSSENSIGAKGITATCPVGKRLIAAGGEVANGLGQVFLVAVRPSSDLTAATAFAVEDENGTDLSWSLTSRALCATPPPGLERVSATSASDSATTKGPTASCPAGKGLLSTGFDLESSLGQVFLSSVDSDGALSQVTATGTEDATGLAIDWTATAYGICASP